MSTLAPPPIFDLNDPFAETNPPPASSNGPREDTMKNMYLTFRLGREDYGIEIRYVTEIVGMQKITEVPDMPNFVKGVVNLRGQVIPVVDMRLRFHMGPREYDERTCIVVVSINNVEVGLVVDTVNEVRSIDEDHISLPPAATGTDTSRYIQGMGKVGEQVIILLEGRRLLHDHMELPNIPFEEKF